MTMIQQNDFVRQWEAIKEKTLAAIDRVGKSGWLILGEEVRQFEKKLAQYCGADYTVGCANGLDALEIALRCLNLPLGAKVLTTPMSAFATTLSIIRAGGVPVFVDIDDSGLIDLNLCATVLKQNPDIRYFMPVHLYGHALSLSQLNELKKHYNLFLIEDCAQAIGAKSNGKVVGNVGDIAAISFYPTKNLGCLGDGGAILTNNSEHYKKAQSLRDYGQTQKYEHTELGMNSRLDELQAAILNDALLPKLDYLTARRSLIAARYMSEINNTNITLPKVPNDSSSVWHLFPILIKENRQTFQNYMKNAGISTGVHYPKVISAQAALITNNIPFVTATPLLNAEYFAAHEVSLPIHPYLTDNEVDKIIHACNLWEK